MAFLRISRVVLSVLVLLGLTGCSEDTPVPLPCAVIPEDPTSSLQQGLLMVGQQASLSVMPLRPNGCTAEPTWPTSVTAEIQGPDGEPVEGKIELGAPGTAAVLQFTPVRPGSHHLLVAFESVGGLHQFDFYAVQDSSLTATAFRIPGLCTSLQRTLQGTWVCDTQVIRGETVVRTFPGARLAVAGDVIWAVSSTGIERYVDTGADLVSTGVLSLSQISTEFLLASPDELAILFSNAVGLYQFSGGTLRSAGVEPWSHPDSYIGILGPYGILLRDGEHLAVGTRLNLNNNPAVQLCKYRIVASRFQRVAEPCLVIPGDTVGFEPAVLWTRDPALLSGAHFDQGSIRRWEWTGGRIVEQSSLALVDEAHILFPPLVGPSHVPIIYSNRSTTLRAPRMSAAALWSAERRAILFESLDEGLLQPNASPTLYWGLEDNPSASHITRVRLRPQAPIR